MDLPRAAELTLNVVNKMQPGGKTQREPEGKSPAHARWMLEGIRAGYVSGEKGHRWLGYAQGLLVVAQLLTLDDAKRVSREAEES